MSGGFEFLRETLRTRNGCGEDEYLIEDDLVQPLDTATAPPPRHYPEDDSADDTHLIEDRDPAIPIDTATAKTPGLLLAQLLAKS